MPVTSDFTYVVFDLGGVACRFDPMARLQALEHATALPAADVDTIWAAWSHAFAPDDDVLALVDRLACPAVLFSNNGPMVDACLDHELLRVRRRFAHVLLSWRLAATKPDPAAYEAASTYLATEPGRLFFVDDSQANVDAARRAGWRAEVFCDVRELERSLAAAGLFAP